MKDPRALIGVAVSLIAVALLLYVVDVREVLSDVSHADPFAVGVVIVTTLFAMWVKAIRWRYFFTDPSTVRRRGLPPCLYIGKVWTTILPLRAGRGGRGFLAAETEHQNTS